MSECYIKITRKKVTTRIVHPSHTRSAELLQKFAAISEREKLTVDPRVYIYDGVLVRSKSEERAAIKLLDLIL